MNIEEVILRRRAIRSFTSENIESELINKIVEAGIWAPSGGNAQATLFIIVTDLYEIKSIRNYSPGMHGIPPMIIVLGIDQNKAQKSGERDWKILSTMDLAMAAENMMLRAFDLGIGSCPIFGFDKNKIKNELSVPADVSLDLLITFGKPAYIGKAPIRSHDLIYFEKFGKKYEGNIQTNIEFETIEYMTFQREQLVNLLGFAIYSAKNLLNEPKEYGVIRVLEIIGRILDNSPNLEKNEILIKIKSRLDKFRFGGRGESKEEIDRELEEISTYYDQWMQNNKSL